MQIPGVRVAAGLLAVLLVAQLGAAVAGRANAAVPPPYPCRPRVTNDGTVIAGLFDDAGLIGWEGNAQGVVACLGGSFYVRDGRNATYGFGAYDDTRTQWVNADGYLPALVTSFKSDGVAVSITNFGDDVTLGGHPFVVVYSRFAVHNPTAAPVTLSPGATPGLLALNDEPDTVAAGATVTHDYAIAADRFGGSYAWPTAAQLLAAGGYDSHFAHMADYWNSRLSAIADITSLPDPSLIDAYKTGFIYTQIIKSGDHLDTGPDNYNMVFTHDSIGILTNLFTQGDYRDAHDLLLQERTVIGSDAEYNDGLWTYSWPWAEYLLKTGDLAFVKANFATDGPGGASEPSIQRSAHAIAADRTGPGGVMEETGDIDSNGYWTVDNYEALFGLTAYRYLAQAVGDATEVRWATSEYNSLLAAVNKALEAIISADHIDYIPCAITGPNIANRCAFPMDANWASVLGGGLWAWDGYLFGARQTGPAISLVDDTYAYGFGRLRGLDPANTFGGYPWRYFYSTGYNAGYGSSGLIGERYRDQGILSYEFMIANTQAGPYSWWESTGRPIPGDPWVGTHPTSGQGSSPHAWGMADANEVLLGSLAAQRSDGTLVVGRGVPDAWVTTGDTMAVSNFPTVDGGRIGLTITTDGTSVRLSLSGTPAAAVLWQLPAFLSNIAGVSSGTYDEASGTVTLAAGSRAVTVTLQHAVS